VDKSEYGIWRRNNEKKMERKQFRDHIEVIMYYIVKRKQISEAKRVCREHSRQIIFCIYEKKG
jgi:hypothetical protein